MAGRNPPSLGGGGRQKHRLQIPQSFFKLNMDRALEDLLRKAIPYLIVEINDFNPRIRKKLFRIAIEHHQSNVQWL